MGKRAKDEAPNPNSVSNRDIIQRLNFLYQASVYLNSVPCEASSSQPPTTETSGDASGQGKTRKGERKRKLKAKDLSKSYIKSMKIVGKKTVVKMDPTVKRTICKGCDSVLVPGSTATVRIKSSSSHGHAVTYTCIGCKTSRRIPAPPTLASTSDASSSVPISGSDKTLTATSDEPGHEVTLPIASKSQNQRKKNPTTPRPLPLFLRGAGHVVFCGNEKLPEEDGSTSFVG